MRSALKIAGGIVIGFLALIGLCALCMLAFSFGLIGALGIPWATPTPSGIIPPGATPPAAPRMPASPGEAMGRGVRRDDLLIVPLEYRFAGEYRSRRGNIQRPPEGAKFLWVRIAVENSGEHAAQTPFPSKFLIRYKEKDIHADHLTSEEESPVMPAYKFETICPGVRREGWLRFTIPARAQPEDLLLVFRPLLSFWDEALWRLTP